MKLYWPVKSPWDPPYISQKFGERPEVYAPYKGHMGIDFPAVEGAPDFATHDCTIVEVREDTAKNGYGYIVIEEFEEDGFTWQVLHAHHSKNEAVLGQKFKAGQEIGKVGSTGFSTGPHVHLGLKQFKNGVLLNQNNGYFGFIDPMPYLLNKGTMTKKYRIQDGEKLGIAIFEGFTGTVLFADTISHYQTLCTAYGVSDSTPLIKLP